MAAAWAESAARMSAVVSESEYTAQRARPTYSIDKLIYADHESERGVHIRSIDDELEGHPWEVSIWDRDAALALAGYVHGQNGPRPSPRRDHAPTPRGRGRGGGCLSGGVVLELKGGSGEVPRRHGDSAGLARRHAHLSWIMKTQGFLRS